MRKNEKFLKTVVLTVRRVSKTSSDMNQTDQEIKCLLTSVAKDRVFAFSKPNRSKIVRAEAKLEGVRIVNRG